MVEVLDEIEYEQPETVIELEDLMAEFGYEVWPWRKAYQEFFTSCCERMGGQFLSSKSKLMINDALVATHKELRDLANQEVQSTERAKYLKRVKELKAKIQSVKGTLNYLRELAAAESDHPALANEILAKVRGFEHSICDLGPELKHHEVESSVEFFRGRREELNRLRGINHAVVVDFET